MYKSGDFATEGDKFVCFSYFNAFCNKLLYAYIFVSQKNINVN